MQGAVYSLVIEKTGVFAHPYKEGQVSESPHTRTHTRAHTHTRTRTHTHTHVHVHPFYLIVPNCVCVYRQYVFINCPMVSSYEWHPFSISSAPDEQFVTFHIKV